MGNQFEYLAHMTVSQQMSNASSAAVDAVTCQRLALERQHDCLQHQDLVSFVAHNQNYVQQKY